MHKKLLFFYFLLASPILNAGIKASYIVRLTLPNDTTVRQNRTTLGGSRHEPDSANIEFEALNEIIEELDKLGYTYEKSSSLYAIREKYYLKYRYTGLTLWYKYPSDKRKYEWFFRTMQQGAQAIHYWNDVDSGAVHYFNKGSAHENYYAPINWKLLHEWEEQAAKFRAEYLKYITGPGKNDVNPDRLIGEILEFEFRNYIKLSLNDAYRGKGKVNIERLIYLLKRYATWGLTNPGSELSDIPIERQKKIDYNFVTNYLALGLTDLDMISIFDTLKKSNIRGLPKWANQKKTLFTFNQDPFDIEHADLEGKIISLKDYRGKVVLVDFWSTWCTSCIRRMPYIKDVYTKYKADGFEVISGCLNNADKLEEVKEIEKRIDGGWPTMLIGGSAKEGTLGHKIWKKYGFSAVPVLFLFDKQGKLRMFNGVLADGNFEDIIEKLLAE